MKIEANAERTKPNTWIVLDIESAVIDESGHGRYQQMERWIPTDEAQPSRRNYTRSEDPLKTPRWPFQTIVTASVIVLSEHADGNVEVSSMVTLSAPDHDERAIVEGVFNVLKDAPKGAEMVSWAGSFHDLPLIIVAAQKHGVTLPAAWKWIAFGGDGRVPHIDLARIVTGGLKMKPVHQAEYAAALDIPAKVSAAPFMVTKLIYAEQWDLVIETCEMDTVTLACIFARWRHLIDGRVPVGVVEDRILRQVIELRGERGYVAALEQHRAQRFAQRVVSASNDAQALAPWLYSEAA